MPDVLRKSFKMFSELLLIVSPIETYVGSNNTNNLMFKVQKCYKRIAKKKHHHHHHHHHRDDHDHDRQLPVDDCEWRPSYVIISVARSKQKKYNFVFFSLQTNVYHAADEQQSNSGLLQVAG
uniref:Uncharacterized protein n=1 Tax=Glossina pallidipes TaxID=7398 RepID=A0A1A9Z4C9_GLOPL